jgi:hypothetical protein
MKKAIILAIFLFLIISPASYAHSDTNTDDLSAKVTVYFDGMFAKLKTVAEAQPTAANFRSIAQPALKNIPGLFGGSFIDNKWVIRQSLFAIHAMARGFDLSNVPELRYFQEQMKKVPGPQLSEPGHGSIVQPRLIAMRYPVMKDGKVVAIVSMMVKTEYFLQAVGLNKAKAFRISCLGKEAEKRGKLSDKPQVVELSLPSTTWKIEYDK